MPLLDHIPELDDRRYADILAEARARIPRYTTEWTDLNDNEPGMALVQLFAWMTDMMLYRMGRVPELNYLKFLQLIGIELIPAQPARTEISFPVLATAPTAYAIVPLRTQVSAESSESPRPIVFETDRALYALRASLASVQAYDDRFQDVTKENNSPPKSGYHPFGSHAPVGAALYLGFDDPAPFPPEIELNLAIFVVNEGPARRVTCGGSAITPVVGSRIAWEYWSGSNDWRTLSLLKDETLAFTRSGHVYLRTPTAGLMAKRTLGSVTATPQYWIRARLTRTAYDRAPRLLTVRTNTVAATQAESVQDEILGGSNGRPDQTFQLANWPVLPGTLVLEVDEGRSFLPWKEVEDLYGAAPTDQVFILNRSSGQIRFGNQKTGAIPSGNPNNPGANIVARFYRFGGGREGNVPAGTVKTLAVTIPEIDDAKVGNLFDAAGARAEETVKEAQERAPHMLRSRTRAVTVEDFEALAKEAAEIRRAKALPLFHPGFPGAPVPGVVTVIVVPDVEGDRPTPSEGTLRSVCACLDRTRLLTTEVFVVAPTYRRVHVTADVIAEDTADLAAVKIAIEDGLKTYFHPLTGGEDKMGWPFGGDIFYSRVFNRVSVAGVQRIERMEIELEGTTADPCTNVPLCDGMLLYSTEHSVTVNYSFEV